VGRRTRGPEGTWAGERDSAKVQIGAELLCKGERGEAARGHVGMVTWGQGEEAGLKGGSIGKPDS